MYEKHNGIDPICSNILFTKMIVRREINSYSASDLLLGLPLKHRLAVIFYLLSCLLKIDALLNLFRPLYLKERNKNRRKITI